MEPGVYLMRGEDGKVIYVGKAKKLRNRVSQYFQDTASHSPKTRMMVSKIRAFDIIVASNEFEALVLECAQIKRYMPKYNILLKDDKGYPQIRLNINDRFPRPTIVSKPSDDGALYFGPFGSRGVTQNILETLSEILKLPNCGRVFPRDIGKGRPCLNFHMNRCVGWCAEKESEAEYSVRIYQLQQILSGNFSSVLESIKSQMLEASEMMNFELAANLRDRMRAIEGLKQKQFVVSGNSHDIDAIGYAQTEAKACFAILHFSGGELVDKEYEILNPEEGSAAVSSLLKQYYLYRGIAPKLVLLPMEIEDSSMFSDLMLQQTGKRTVFRVPQRGENRRLMELACKNALEEAQRITGKEERHNAVLELLGNMLGISKPVRIESFDISNISGTDNVASMVVFVNAVPRKKDYKRFKIDLNEKQDDYESMRQVLTRRLNDFVSQKDGFHELPDLWLIDGGVAHASIAQEVLRVFQLSIPVFGMVKDDRHRTRALVTHDGREIRIDNQQSVFSLIGNIQEQTHHFAISYHQKLRAKRLRKSELDNISGIGPKRKAELLKAFSSVSAIRSASLEELQHYLPVDAARSVFFYFHSQEG